MKKILLSLTTLLAITTLTLYAACTTDVDMGGNKIKDLGNGTAAGNAVNWEQTLQMTTVDVNETNSSILDGSVKVRKKGGICVMHGPIQNNTGSTLSGTLTYGNVPAGFRPMITKWMATGGLDVSQGAWSYFADLRVLTNGDIILHGERNALPDTKSVLVNMTYMCN